MPYHLICRCLPATATVCPVREVERASRRATAPGWQAKSGRWKAAAGGQRLLGGRQRVADGRRQPEGGGTLFQVTETSQKTTGLRQNRPFLTETSHFSAGLRHFSACSGRERVTPPLSPRATAVPRHGAAALRLTTGPPLSRTAIPAGGPRQLRFRSGRCRVFLLPLQGL